MRFKPGKGASNTMKYSLYRYFFQPIDSMVSNSNAFPFRISSLSYM